MSQRSASSVLGGYRLDILINFLCLSLPMLVLSAGFVSFVLVYQVDLQSTSTSPLHVVGNASDPNAYYVDIDSTLLVFIASWMSSLAPIMSGFAISLAAYPIAQRLLQDSEARNFKSLPTSFQFSIVLRLIVGSVWSALWSLIMYNGSWTRRVDRHATILVSLALVTIVTMVLSTGIFIADTWLHISTTSQIVLQVIPFSGSQAPYSLILDSGCTEANNSYTALSTASANCTLRASHPSPVLAESYPALQLLGNQSDSLAVLDIRPKPDASLLHYLSPAPTSVNDELDFTAETFALQPSCAPISRACNLTIASNVTFYCDNSTFFTDDDHLNTVALYQRPFRYPKFDNGGDSQTHGGVENPFYFAMAFTTQVMGTLSPSILRDPEAITYDDSMLAIVLACNITAFDISYDVVQGKVTRFDTKLSNVSTTNALASAVTSTPFGLSNIESTMHLASASAGSAQEMADHYAASLSTAMLSGAAGAVRRAPTIIAQERKQLLVSRLPKAPFYSLVAFNLCFAVLGIVLAVLAVRTTQEARQVQLRLSTASLVARLFDPRQAGLPVGDTDDMFEEYHQDDKREVERIAVHRTIDGGFELRASKQQETQKARDDTSAAAAFLIVSDIDDQTTQYASPEIGLAR